MDETVVQLDRNYNFAFNKIKETLSKYYDESEFIKQIISLGILSEYLIKDDLNSYQLLIDKGTGFTYLTKTILELAREVENNDKRLYYGPEWLMNIFDFINRKKDEYNTEEDIQISPKNLLIIYWVFIIILFSHNDDEQIGDNYFNFSLTSAINKFETIFKCEGLYKPKKCLKGVSSKTKYKELNFFEKIYSNLLSFNYNYPWFHDYNDYRKLIIEAFWCDSENYRTLIRSYELLKLENKNLYGITPSKFKAKVKSKIKKLKVNEVNFKNSINLTKFLTEYLA